MNDSKIPITVHKNVWGNFWVHIENQDTILTIATSKGVIEHVGRLLIENPEYSFEGHENATLWEVRNFIKECK